MKVRRFEIQFADQRDPKILCCGRATPWFAEPDPDQILDDMAAVFNLPREKITDVIDLGFDDVRY